MELVTDPGMPAWIRWLVYIAVAMSACTYLCKTILNKLKETSEFAQRKMIERINAEMNPNGGGSLKDLVTSAAADSKEALDITKEMSETIKSDSSKLIEVCGEVGALKLEVSALKNKVDTLEKKQARQIVHEARNTLHRSNLLKEEESLLNDGKIKTVTGETI